VQPSKNLVKVLVAGAIALAGLSWAASALKSAPDDLNRLVDNKDYIDISTIPNMRVSLRYASENNFLGKNIYGDFHQCLLQRIAADKLRQAGLALERERPGWKFVIFDCLRPRSLQETLYTAVKGTPRQPYVADPRAGSLHNFGFAIDLSLEDETGRELDMGTLFDDFTALSRPDQELKNKEEGKLSAGQLEHRSILRKIMLKAGFIQLPIEWWHYDALPKEEVKAHYKIVE
jgi:D-alanyl-D-alanine dipeptidase